VAVIGRYFCTQWLCLRQDVAISASYIYADGVRHSTQYYVENFVELCIRSSRSIEFMKKLAWEKSLISSWCVALDRVRVRGVDVNIAGNLLLRPGVTIASGFLYPSSNVATHFVVLVLVSSS